MTSAEALETFLVSHSWVWLYFAYLFSSRYVRLCMAAFICHALGITFMAKKSSKSSKTPKSVDVLRTVFSSQCRSQMQILNQCCQLSSWSIPQSFRYTLLCFFIERSRRLLVKFWVKIRHFCPISPLSSELVVTRYFLPSIPPKLLPFSKNAKFEPNCSFENELCSF